ncbi:MAG: hypothetical protein KDE51_16010 [Anaerolineales bacterium]|nr:hypothetical protein [Anaerolineales bacterium]
MEPSKTRMNHGRRWGAVGSGLLLILVGLLYFAQPTAAYQTRWARWTIDLDFANNELNDELFIEVGHETQSGDLIVELTNTVDLDCKLVGNVAISNEEATFGQGDYIVCSMPSLIKEVASMTRGKFDLPAGCPVEDPWIEAELTAAAGEGVEFGAPLFYRPDLQFGATLVSGGGKAHIQFIVDGAGSGSSLYAADGGIDTISAHWTQVNATTYTPSFTANGTPLTAVPNQVTGQLELTNHATEIYFGYSPDFNTYFEGTLRSIRIDPPCIGRG